MHWNGSGAQETLVLRDLVAYTRQLARMRAAALRVYCHQRRYLVAVSFVSIVCSVCVCSLCWPQEECGVERRKWLIGFAVYV